MSMSDCPKCWETPCMCGYDYRGWSIERLEAQIKMLQEVLSTKKKLLQFDSLVRNISEVGRQER